MRRLAIHAAVPHRLELGLCDETGLNLVSREVVIDPDL